MTSAGKIHVKGTLADGTAFTENTTLSESGQWPLFASLYRGDGLILGWMTFSDRLSDDLHGSVAWIKHRTSKPPTYPEGFTNEILAVGSAYIPPRSGMNILNFTNAEIAFSGGNLTAPFRDSVLLNGRRVTALGSNSLSMNLTLPTGLFKGRATDPDSGRKILFRGAVVQKLNQGFGFFLGPTESGSVVLGPAPE